MDLPIDIKKKIAEKIEAIPLGHEEPVYNWAEKMYREIFGRHHLEDFPDFKAKRGKDKRLDA